MKHSAIRLAGQWLLLTGSLLGALVAAGASMYISIGFGLKISIVIAIVFGLADFMKVYMPLSASAQGGMKNWQKAIWWVAVSLAVMAASSHLIEMQGERLQHALSANRSVETQRADEDLIRSRLIAITETISVADAKALAAKADKAAADAETVVKQAGIKCDQRKSCAAAAAKATAAAERLSAAVARDELKAQLAGIKPVTVQHVEVFGPAKQLAAITGWDENVTASTVILIISVLCLLLLEVAAAGLALDAGKRIAAMAKTLDSAKTGKPLVIDPIETSDKLTEAEALTKIKLLVFHAPNQELVASQRKLAEMLNVPKSTFADWFARWQAAGVIQVIKTGKTAVVKTSKAA